MYDYSDEDTGTVEGGNRLITVVHGTCYKTISSLTRGILALPPEIVVFQTSNSESSQHLNISISKTKSFYLKETKFI